MGVAAAVSLAGCSPRPEEKPVPVAEPAPQPIPIPALPPPAVDRAELLSVIATSASAFAVGQPLPKAATDLAAKRFSIRMPFGCPGEAPGPASYAYDAEKQSLKLTVRPGAWLEDATLKSLLATPDTEEIEGFWIARPWIATDECPMPPAPMVVPESPAQPPVGDSARPAKPVAEKAVPAPTDKPAAKKTESASSAKTATPAAAMQRVGLAAVFDKGGSRLLRRNGRPYEVIRKSDQPGPDGLRLVLEGRIVAGPDGRAVLCRNDGPSRPPTCVVRVEFDRVAITSPDGETFGEWRS